MATNPADIAPSEDADDFDKAFDEIASGAAEAPAENAGDDDGADPVPEADGESSPPAGEAAGEEANVAGNQPPASAEPSDDIWANAPPELREARERELRDYNFRLQSANGRVSALHRKLNEQSAQPSQRQDGGAKPAPAAGSEADPSGDANDPLAKLVEEYPEIGGPILDTINGLKEQITQLSQPVASIAEAQQVTEKAKQYGILADRHPDWQQLAQDDRWGGWIETQPRAVQEAFARNVDVSDGQEAAWVLDLFKRDMGISAPAVQPAPAPSPTPAPSSAPLSADQRRQKQLDAGRDGGSGGGPTVTNEIPDDFDAEFDRIQAKKRRSR